MKRPMNQPVIVLTHEEREELKRLARKNKVMACFARRAKVILALDEGKSISETARLIEMERRHIYKWLSRYKARGQMGLNDLQRPGRPKSKPATHSCNVESDRPNIVRQNGNEIH